MGFIFLDNLGEWRLKIIGFGDLLGEEAFLYSVKRSKYRAKRLS